MVVVAMVHTCTHNALRYAEITTICCLLLPCLFVWILAVGFLLPCLWWCVTFCLIHSILRCPTTLTMLSRTIMASQGPPLDRCDCVLSTCMWCLLLLQKSMAFPILTFLNPLPLFRPLLLRFTLQRTPANLTILQFKLSRQCCF